MKEEKLDYFWETEKYFEQFLKDIFQDKYRRKFSLTGNGIYNLLDYNGKLYELKYTSTKVMGIDDSHKIDSDKDYILSKIADNLKCNSVIYGGKFITFPVASWIAKVEVVKKLKEPS